VAVAIGPWVACEVDWCFWCREDSIAPSGESAIDEYFLFSGIIWDGGVLIGKWWGLSLLKL
jgi:hypothetical protein